LKALQSAREEAGISQRELARRLGKPHSYVNKSEHADRQINVIEIRAWCVALGIDWLAFLRDVEPHLPAMDANQQPAPPED